MEHKASDLAAILVQAQDELSTLIGHEQRAWSEVYQLEGQYAEADAAGDIRLASTLLNQLIIKKGVARGVAIETSKAYCRVRIIEARKAAAELERHDERVLITAEQAAAADDMAGIEVAA